MLTAKPKVYETLGLSDWPVLLAPLAGVSDHPFRRICSQLGAELTYVEMISATALIYESERTLDMLKRHESESKLGVQITGRNAEDTARAVSILDKMPFETIDINMGCPVTKIVKTGCGSAILKDPKRVFETVHLCTQETAKPITVKIRLGWDRQSMNATEVADAAVQAGAAWICVHGRTRSDDYSAPVELDMICQVKKAVEIPIIGNGNIFGHADTLHMRQKGNADGVMVSRGALGDPWVFSRIKGLNTKVTPQMWFQVVRQHLQWQLEEYADASRGNVCMRKHLLWYLKGWPQVREFKERINQSRSLSDGMSIVEEVVLHLERLGIHTRSDSEESHSTQINQRFNWDPKFEMDRQLDRGVGTDGLEVASS